MQLAIYQIDAFARHVFEGNPAAVIPLDDWLDDDILLAIAEENNLSETAFIVKNDSYYRLRWFTPAAEVDLCGHATLAAAHVIFNHLGHAADSIRFMTRSGELSVTNTEQGLMMDFPATDPEPITTPELIEQAFSIKPKEVLLGFDHIVVFDTEQQVLQASPNFDLLRQLQSRGVVITAQGSTEDCVSRCFFPNLNVSEDPVTGSAHCQLAPYWAHRLNKPQIVAYQASERGGLIHCEVIGERVQLTGSAVDYMVGTINLLKS